MMVEGGYKPSSDFLVPWLKVSPTIAAKSGRYVMQPAAMTAPTPPTRLAYEGSYGGVTVRVLEQQSDPATHCIHLEELLIFWHRDFVHQTPRTPLQAEISHTVFSPPPIIATV